MKTKTVALTNTHNKSTSSNNNNCHILFPMTLIMILIGGKYIARSMLPMRISKPASSMSVGLRFAQEVRSS